MQTSGLEILAAMRADIVVMLGHHPQRTHSIFAFIAGQQTRKPYFPHFTAEETEMQGWQVRSHSQLMQRPEPMTPSLGLFACHSQNWFKGLYAPWSLNFIHLLIQGFILSFGIFIA